MSERIAVIRDISEVEQIARETSIATGWVPGQDPIHKFLESAVLIDGVKAVGVIATTGYLNTPFFMGADEQTHIAAQDKFSELQNSLDGSGVIPLYGYYRGNGTNEDFRELLSERAGTLLRTMISTRAFLIPSNK